MAQDLRGHTVYLKIVSNNEDEIQKLLAGLDQKFDVALSPQDQAINRSSDSLDETAPLPEDGN